MRIILTANLVPFMPGGADNHINGLEQALIDAGHEVETLRFPFKFSPESDIQRLMEYTNSLSLEEFNGISIDQVISLQFPAYGAQHSNQTIWVMHQHRAAYELYDAEASSTEQRKLRDAIHQFDKVALGRAKQLFANSHRVAERLKEFNNIEAEPLYHPPMNAERFFCGDSRGYIFCPSRVETLKRQELLIRALAHTQTDIPVLVAGDGGQLPHIKKLSVELGVEDRVRFLGRVSEQEKLLLYAHCAGVFFGPYDEDYGYITLEAMLSSKPVITCTDSGGPTEFIENGRNGFVCEPNAVAVADALDRVHMEPDVAKKLGQQGFADYLSHQISWHQVVKRLTGN